MAQPRLLLPGSLLVLGLILQLFLFLNMEHGTVNEMPLYTPNELLMGKPAAFLLTMRGLLLLSVFSAFVAALGEGSAFFDPSDIDFLFTAPLSHRSVLLFKMVGRYLSLLFPAAYLPIAFAGAFLTGVTTKLIYFLPGIIGSWFFLSVVANITQVFLLRSSHDYQRGAAQGDLVRTAARAAIITMMILGGIWILVHGFTPREVLALSRPLHSASIWKDLLPDVWATSLFHAVFDGFRQEDAWCLVRLFLLLCVSFVWLFFQERDFYESATELSVRRAKFASAVQSGDAGAVLSQMAQDGRLSRGRTLPDFGGGARAILWKDLVAATRIPLRSWSQLLIPAAFPALIGGLLGKENGLNVLGWTVLFSLQMPSIFLLTLRDVLRRADISKSLPISPVKLLGGELILPLFQLVLIGWLSLGMVWAVGLWHGSMLWVATMVLPSLSALLFFIQAVFVLMYPKPQDPAQHAVNGVVSLVVSIVALVPPFLVGVPLFVCGVSPWILAFAVSLVNTVGAVIALAVAAKLWQRFDPTD
jgi:hypothetical protein